VAAMDEIRIATGTDAVRIHLMGHSEGGLITRQYLMTRYASPGLKRYVTFDAPHGGTTAPWLTLLDSHFTIYHECNMNGWSPLLKHFCGIVPVTLGWNHFHNLGRLVSSPESRRRILMFDVLDDNVIYPGGSARGVGRIGIFDYDSILLGCHPGGCCQRFVWGWEMTVITRSIK
jgi:pimeloyl-ACP methyl ester carboxylesterase